MSTMINKLNCQQITTKLQEIHLKREQYGAAVDEGNFPEAFKIKSELTKLIDELKKELTPVFNIEGKEFPVFTLEIGGKTKQELENELNEKNIKFSPYIRGMLDNPDFTTLPSSEKINLVKLKVRDLGIPEGITTDQLYLHANNLGLKLCPAEVGPHQLLEYEDQPLRGEEYIIAMKQITDRDGDPFVFRLDHDDAGLWLYHHWAKPDDEWDADDEVVFRLPPDSKE